MTWGRARCVCGGQKPWGGCGGRGFERGVRVSPAQGPTAGQRSHREAHLEDLDLENCSRRWANRTEAWIGEGGQKLVSLRRVWL